MPLFSDINTWALIALVIGLGLMVLEIFTPGFGLCGGCGLVLMAIAVILQAKSLLEAVILTTIILVVLGIAFLIAVRSAQKGRLSRSPIILKESIGEENPAKEELFGKEGVAVTPLRPSGTVKIGEERISAVTDGEWLSAGTKVTVAGMYRLTPVVRKVEE